MDEIESGIVKHTSHYLHEYAGEVEFLLGKVYKMVSTFHGERPDMEGSYTWDVYDEFTAIRGFDCHALLIVHGLVY